MTGEFSRRSFLKYTALTAVAVAGSSLLTGCSGYAPVQHAPGTSNVVLKVVSTLDMVECHADDDGSNATTIFKLVVTNGRNNALEVTKANFAVKAEGYLADQNDKLQVTSPDALSYQVKQGETVTIKKITGKDEIRQHLAELGFVVESEVTVVNEIAGNLILQVKESRIALDKTMANRIMIG